MKIVHIQHPYLPDYGYQENYLPSCQADLGHDVTILTSTVIPPKFRKNFGCKSFEPGEYEYKGVETIRLPSWLEIEVIGDVILRGLQKHLEEYEPDVIHAHGLISPRTLQAYRYARTYDTKLFVDVHIDNGNFSLDRFYKKSIFNIYNSVILPRLANEVTSFLAVNGYANRFLIERTNIPKEKVEFLPLGVSQNEFYRDPEAGRKIRGELEIPEDQFVIVFAGNIDPTKGVNILLRSLSGVSEDFICLLVGDIDDKYKSHLEGLANTLCIQNNILFIDSVPHEQLSDYLNAADIGVWPGKLGVTCIEAIGTGLPIIVTANDAMEYFVSNQNGFTFARNDVASLTERIQHYINNPSIIEAHSQNASTFAQEELYWTNIARTSLRMYQN